MSGTSNPNGRSCLGAIGLIHCFWRMAASQRASAGGKPARERLTLIRVFEELRALGYEGGYDAVRRYARTWSKQHAGETANAYVPLTFAPGEAYQFDWSYEIVVMDGVTRDQDAAVRGRVAGNAATPAAALAELARDQDEEVRWGVARNAATPAAALAELARDPARAR